MSPDLLPLLPLLPVLFAVPQIRLLARQHAFGGYGRWEEAPLGGLRGMGEAGEAEAVCAGVCTRHHAIDWNFVGTARPRPNKWRVQPTPASLLLQAGAGGTSAVKGVGRLDGSDGEPGKVTDGAPGKVTDGEEGKVTGSNGGERRKRPRTDERPGVVDDWLELSWANDDGGAPYYFERWTRYEGGTPGEASRDTIALRAHAAPAAAAGTSTSQSAHRPPRDALVVVVGDHFNYVVERPIGWEALAKYGGSLVGVVDAAISSGERAVAEACVLLEAGHGRVSAGWRVDASLQPWRIGKPLSDVFGGEGGGGGSGPSLAEALSAGGAIGADGVFVGRQRFEVL